MYKTNILTYIYLYLYLLPLSIFAQLMNVVTFQIIDSLSSYNNSTT